MNINAVFHGQACEVRVLEYSKSDKSMDKSAITFQLRYWRAIHAEVMTHRVFSRNASSSRAIPTAKLLATIREYHPLPVFWGANQPGMQAAEECNNPVIHPRTGESLTREQAWKLGVADACDWAAAFADAGYHKQLSNRFAENLGWINVVLTSTQWDNWFELRDHEDAQPEIRDLARTMRRAVQIAQPRIISHHELTDARSWHLPYISMEERKAHPINVLLALSAARCARVSYMTHDGQHPSIEKDYELYRRLVESKPLHASPLEHQAIATAFTYPSQNFTGGFMSHRKLLETAGSIDEMVERMGL